jgi:urease accessory protein
LLRGSEPDLPGYVRAEGRLKLRAGLRGGKSVIADIEEHGSCRARFPRHSGAALEATLVNVAGGIAGGDRYSVDLTVEAGTTAMLTTAAAERVYRSLGESARIETRIALADRATAIWMPQELLLYEGARLERRIEADIAPLARLCLTEIMVLGRTESGETLHTAMIRDRWRLWRNGALIFAENLMLDTPLLADQRPSRLDGRSIIATSLLIAPDAVEMIDAARNMLGDDSRCDCAISAWNGMLLLRARANNADAIKQRLAEFWRGLNLFEMPRIWG